jgi:uncharacterized protein YkwD
VPTGTPARHRAAHGRAQPPGHAPLHHARPSGHGPAHRTHQPGHGPSRRAGRPARRYALRAWYLLCGLLVLAAVGLYLARGSGPAAPAASGNVTDLQTPASCGPAAAGSCAGRPFHAAVASVPPAPSSSARARRHAARPASVPSPSSSSAAPSPTPAATGPAAAAPGSPAARVLALISQARSAAGLPPLTVTAGLDTSASAHNQIMAGGCGLSHQCPGEPGLGARETAAGVTWSACGENIGEGGPVADTTAAIAQMAVGLTQDMLNEQPPDDGHRKNILSSSFTHIGIAVYRDASGTVWLTQDFSN